MVTPKDLSVFSSVDNEQTLHQRSFSACQTYRKRSETFEMVRQSVIRRVHACVDFGGRRFVRLLRTVS